MVLWSAENLGLVRCRLDQAFLWQFSNNRNAGREVIVTALTACSRPPVTRGI